MSIRIIPIALSEKFKKYERIGNNFVARGVCTLKLPNNTATKKCIVKIKHMKCYLAIDIVAIHGMTYNLKS